jgi:hypothetical protein
MWKKSMRTMFVAGLLGLGACAPAEDVPEVPSPDETGKADGEPFKLKGTIAYGQTVKGRLYGTKTWDGYTVDVLEGAVLTVTGTSGRGIAVYGPEDRAGTWGQVPQASRAAGTHEDFVIPEDGRYVVIIGGKRGNYELTLSCAEGCDVDPDAGKALVNAADEAVLDAAGLDGDDIMAYRAEYGFAATHAELGLEDVADDVSLSLHAVFFSPKIDVAWGWSAEARARQWFVKRATEDTVDWGPGNVAAPVVDLFRRAESEICVAMYGMSPDEGAALVAAANRGVRVKVYLDVSERDPDGNPYTETVIRSLLQTPNVEVRVPKYSSKMMHEKFGLIDGLHVFDGSANVSRKAKDVYTEDRFVFLASPGVVAQFQDEWNRLWGQLGKDATTILN